MGAELMLKLFLWKKLTGTKALSPSLAALLPLHQAWCLHSLPLIWMSTALPFPLRNGQWFLLIHENTAAAMPRAQ